MELFSGVKGKIRPWSSKHSRIAGKQNLMLGRCWCKCQSSVPDTAHSWKQPPVLFLLCLPSVTPTALPSSCSALFLSLVVSRLVCSVEITKCPDFLLPRALGWVKSTDVYSWWQSLLAGCASAFVWGLALLCEASWGGILGICFHLDQTVEPIEESLPTSLCSCKP